MKNRRLLVENNGELFRRAKEKAVRIIRTNKNYNIKDDLKFIETVKEELRKRGRTNKRLFVYIDYWNLVAYYLRRIVYEHQNN